MKYFQAVIIFSLFCFNQSFSQKKNKKSKNSETVFTDLLIPNLQQHIRILASDSLEGRRTGTLGEQRAASYIKKQFYEYGIGPKGENESYFQTFEVNEGKQYESHSTFYINDFILQTGKDFFPLNISGNGSVNEIASPILKDPNTTWFLDLKDELIKNEKNPHFDVLPYITEKAKEYASKGAAALVVLNTHNKLADQLAFDPKGFSEPLKIPVVYLNRDAFKKYIKTNDAAIEIRIHIEIRDKKRTGTNILGWIDNKAPQTIILGAHFDHLGYGEDHNSLYTGNPMVHNGADDNASGVAALLELSRLLKNTGNKNSNYLFIAFSGEELGLFGSKYFTEHPTINLGSVNYMINMDMVGRLNDSTQTLTIGGFGTSPSWGDLLKPSDKWNAIHFKTDSSGTGPSDHTSFYKKDIPVLFFFTGVHGDYHKPSDDYEKINFGGEEKIVQFILSLVNQTTAQPRLVFTKTRENNSGSSRSRFTVSLGIMPDYTFNGPGVKADGISEGKLAQKIGLQPGDIIMKLGDQQIGSVENYMKVLGSFKKGDHTKLVIDRGGKQMEFDITF